MNTQLLETLKEKWTKKSTKIACASVGTVAVLGVVGVLVACNLPHTEQVVAEDGTITTVQTPQKESHGLFDIFHAPKEPATEATSTEITPPQTNADGTPSSASTAAPGTPQATTSGDTTSNLAATNAQAQTPSNTPTPAPADASALAPAAAEQSATVEPTPAEESPTSTPAPVHNNQWVKPVWVVDQPEVKAIPPKYNIIYGEMTSDGKFFPEGQEKARIEYCVAHKVGVGTWQKKELIDPGRPYSPEKGHWEDPTTGKRLSPTYERSH